MDEKQTIQEVQYEFPYHHLCSLGKDFSLHKYLYWGCEYASYLEYVIDKIREHKNGNSILDIGCGDGKLLNELSRIFSTDRIIGIDYSPRAAAIARYFNPTLDIHAGDVANQRVSNVADVVTLVEVLEHIPIDEVFAFVKGIRNHIKKDGVLILTVPSTNVPTNKKHFQHFDRQTIEEALSPFFTIHTCTYLNKVGFLSRLIQIMLCNRYFLLNHAALKQILYRIYQRHCTVASSQEGARLCVVAKAQVC